ncbi:MAG: flagellar hook-associated protein FlgK [Azonexaceae bacterium]|nr:flagellar hook-associated protein FlgK [Azonexaceae bacterium]
MSSGMLSIGITGIHAAQLGLEATQHNIANANTPGYNRQYILQSAGIPRLTGSGYFGSGTTVDTVRRAYDKYLTAQTFAAQATASESATQLAKLGQIDNMLGDPNSGLATAMQDFFTGVQQVAANPSLVSARQSMLSSAQGLATRFSAMSGRLGELYDSVNGEIASEVELINVYAQQLADINDQITRAEAATSQPPNDLLDMRDQMVADLNKHVRVTTVEDSIGNFNVFVGNGQQLVVGTVVNKLVPMTSSSDPERVVVGLRGQSGTVQELSESIIEGGALGGLMKFRSNSLDDATNALGQIAASVALTFNAQHALGQDLEGLNQTSLTAGFQADFFTYSQPKVLAGSATANAVTANFLPPSMKVVNATGNAYELTSDAGTGNFSLKRLSDGQVWSAADMTALSGLVSAEKVDLNPSNGSFYTNLSGSDYALRNDGTNLTLTRRTDGKTWSTPAGAGAVTAMNALITSEGFSIGGATPTANVDYLIEPTRDAARNFQVNSTIASDVKRIAVAAPSVTKLGATNTGSLKVSQSTVSPGYSLSDLPKFTFSTGLTPAADAFAIDIPGAVTAVYADGSSVSGAAVSSINRLNSGSELTRITYNGISIDISGLPANGDSFSIAANTGGVSDSRNAVKLAALQTQNAMEGGKATFQGGYASLVSGVGSVTRQVKISGESQQALLKQNEMARSAVSGVNLDEEAANLIRYQQAYQASARSLDIASKLFDTLLGITN